MSPHDLLDEFEGDDLAPLSKRQRRRVEKERAKTATRVRRANMKRAYHRKVAETRNAPVRGGVLAVLGIIFFGGLWIVGTVTQNNDRSTVAESNPMLSYAPPSTSETTAPQPVEATSTPEQFAETALRNVFLDATAWPNYVVPDAVDQVESVRLAVLAIAETNTLTIREVEWVDANPDGHEWLGTAHVRFSDSTLAIAVHVTLDFVGDEMRIVQLDGMEPIE